MYGIHVKCKTLVEKVYNLLPFCAMTLSLLESSLSNPSL